MRFCLLLLLCASCSPSTPWQELLTPDELHVFYAKGDATSNGRVAEPAWPNRYQDTNSTTDSQTWGAGLTFYLTKDMQAYEMQRAARSMHIAARLMMDAATAAAKAPVPVVVETPPTPTPAPSVPSGAVQLAVALPVEVLTEWLARGLTVPAVADAQVPVVHGNAPDINITVQGGDQTTSQTDTTEAPVNTKKALGEGEEESTGVTLLGVSPEVRTRLITAFTLFLVALAGWINRHRIPGVKEYTSKGKAAKAEAAKDGHS